MKPGILYLMSTTGMVLFEGTVCSYEHACKITRAIEDGCVKYHVDMFRSSFQAHGDRQISLDFSERT